MSLHSRRLQRRGFLRIAGALGVGLAGVAALPGCRSGSAPAGARRSGKAPVVGILALHPPDPGKVAIGNKYVLSIPSVDSVRRGLFDLGYVDGSSIRFEYRLAGDLPGRLQEGAAELVRMPVDVIVAADAAALQEASARTKTIPIIATFSGDPVATGLVSTLARPGGNVTGPSDLSLELAGKRLELLAGALPSVRNVGIFWNPDLPDRRLAWQHTQDAAGTLGVATTSLAVRSWNDFAGVFESALAAGIDAFVVLADPIVSSGSGNMLLFQNSRRLPGASDTLDWLNAGGFMSYGVDTSDLFRRVAGYVDRILKGERAADLPIDRAARFALLFNQKAAATLGVTIPQPLLAQATGVYR